MPSDVVALAVADLHLSHSPPVARSGEPDWYAAMKRPLVELKSLAYELGVPVLCAGDLFHTPRSNSELVNFAIDTLPPNLIAIPGQHDLLHHNLGDIRKTPFWTILAAGRMKALLTDQSHLIDRVGRRPIRIWPAPWGVPVTPLPVADPNEVLDIALIHQYVWIPGSGYPGAPEEGQVGVNSFKGYDVVISGDNHIPFHVLTRSGTNIWNCGSFMRRNSDQVNHRPRIGLIHEDGSVSPHFLDISKDVLDPTVKEPEPEPEELEEFLQELKGLQGVNLDYPEALRQAVRSSGPEVRQIIEQALGQVNGVR